MVRHIHYKDGWYAVWSSIIEDYLTEWTKNKHEIVQWFIDDIARQTREDAFQMLSEAEKYGCNAGYYFRCDPSEFIVVSILSKEEG